MPTIPKLPPVLVGVLGTLATLLALAGPSLSSPWRELAAAAVAICAAVGVPATVRSVRRHGEDSAHAALTRFGDGDRR